MIKKSLFLVLAFLFASLNSKIYEIQKIEEALPFIDSKTLVVLDIDDTLVVPAQMLGGDCWFRHEMKQLQANGESFEKALAKVLPRYLKLQHYISVVPVEKKTATMVHAFQKKADKVIGLTTRNPTLAYRTIEQLKGLGIDLSKTALIDKEAKNANFLDHDYIEGILFTQVKHKGDYLLALLDKMQYYPKRILFINDKEKYVAQLEETFGDSPVEYVGLRYAACDEDYSRYQAQVAKVQEKYFDTLLSNEDAKTLLEAKVGE